MPPANCVFCGICAKSQPAEFHYEDDDVVVFTDIKPASKHHYLSVPTKHIQDVNKLTREHKPLSMLYTEILFILFTIVAL